MKHGDKDRMNLLSNLIRLAVLIDYPVTARYAQSIQLGYVSYHARVWDS